MHSEKELLTGAREFDETILGEIYDRFSPGLYRYAMRLLGNSELAEDCVAETFSRFLQALQKGGGPRRHLQAYLYRVAHNWITDHYRRKEPLMTPLEVHHSNMNQDPGPAQIVQEMLEIDRVRAALVKLTAEQRQVIVLKYLEGWSNQEIARSLSKPVGAVKSLQHRGLASLKRQLLHPSEKLA